MTRAWWADREGGGPRPLEFSLVQSKVRRLAEELPGVLEGYAVDTLTGVTATLHLESGLRHRQGIADWNVEDVTVADLSLTITSPAVGSSAVGDSARVGAAGREGNESAISIDGDRYIRAKGPGDGARLASRATKLTGAVSAPTKDAAVDKQSARMVSSGVEPRELEAPSY